MPKFQEWNAARVLGELETLPLKSVISVSDKVTTSTRHTFSVGSFGASDFGNLRLVMADLPFSGNSSSGVTVVTDSSISGAGGHTGVGNRRFESNAIPFGTQCVFGGITFDIVGGKLILGDESIDALGEPTMVLIGANRELLEVKPLKTPKPKSEPDA